MTDTSTIVTVTEDGSTVVTTVEELDAKNRICNLVLWFALGGTLPDPD